MRLFDSHAHLTDPRLREETAQVLERARDAGVLAVVTVASDLDDAEAACALASAYDGVWATAGVHPHAAGQADPSTSARLRELLDRAHVVAVGETGLDYHYENAPRAAQRAAFESQLALAAELGLPAVVHSRDADEDTAEMLEAHPGARGVLHCFAGGQELLERGLAAGWSVSFSGLVTFPGFHGRELVPRVPADRLLVETDSPYLAPVPRRGRRNEPANVAHVAAEVASLRREELADVAAITWANARRFYGLEA